MQFKVENVGACRKKVCCTVPSEAVNQQMDKYFSEVSKEVKMPGFRKGKVPMNVIKKRFADEAKQETTKNILSSALQEAVKTENLRPVISPSVENFNQADDQSMTFDLMLEVEPTFELPQYSGMKLESNISTEPTEEEVDKFIEGLRESRATLSDSESGKVEWDNYVLCDYSLKIDGKEVEERKDQWLVMSRQPEMEGFLKPMEGKNPGDVVEGKTTLPEKFPNPEVAGKEVEYRFEIKEVKNKIAPALDEEFAKSFGLESLDSMRKNVAEYMGKEKEAQAHQELEAQIAQKLVDSVSMEMPEQLFNSRVEALCKDKLNGMAERGVPVEDLNKAKEKMTSAAKEDVTRSLKLQYIISAIFEKEKMDLSQHEMIGRMQAMLSRIDPSRKDLIQAWQSEHGAAIIADNLRREKVMTKIIELATVEKK